MLLSFYNIQIPVQLVSSLRAPVGWISSSINAIRKTICSTFPNIKRYIDERLQEECENVWLDLPQSQKKHGIQYKTLVIPYCINNAYYQHVYDFG